MSGFIRAPDANAQGQIIGLAPGNGNDGTHMPVDYQWPAAGLNVSIKSFRDSDLLWPRPSMLAADITANPLIFDPLGQLWEWNDYSTGHCVPKRIEGRTLNSSGSPIGGCVVQLFNTASGEMVDSGTSDSAGNYSLGDPNAVDCFVVAYLDGSPDTAGTTVNNLTGV
jgi:hypothetical protein